MTLDAGKTSQIEVTVVPENATDKTVSYFSNKTDVCTVSATGLITAIAAGNAQISVVSNDNKIINTIVNVTVTTPRVSVTGISIDRTKEVNVNDDFTLTPVIMPANATDKRVEFEIADETVLSVVSQTETSITLRANKVGNTTVKAISHDDSMMETSCAITVVSPIITVDSVEITPSTASINIGETQQFAANVLPENATNKRVGWASSNTDVVVIEPSGLATALTVGTVDITATSVLGQIVGKATLEVTEP